MGIHVAAVAKAKAVVMTMRSQSPIVGGLVFPFVLKLSLSLTLVRKTYCDLVHASRLFVFQLSHIAGDDNGGSRYQRALRLLRQSLTHSRTSQSSQPASPASHDHEYTLHHMHTISMLAL